MGAGEHLRKVLFGAASGQCTIRSEVTQPQTREYYADGGPAPPRDPSPLKRLHIFGPLQIYLRTCRKLPYPGLILGLS